ncbi:MAG: Tyrosine recombinase XerC [Syntrophorhabdaceae bacterium PtaU1.Bin034]|nr:MAG: Tyrosine recombinase XerC [Syntrophorhabdaceae bacterium PtaU1.Bin034]
MAKRQLVKKGKKKGSGEQQYYTGVFSREHATKLHQGRPDVCYDICYKKDGRLVWEKVGWESEGYSPQVAEEVRNNRIRAIRHGEELPKDKPKAPLFKDVAEGFIIWAKSNKKSWKDDESRYTHHLKPEFDEKRLDEISALDIEGFKNKLAKGGRMRREDHKKAGKAPGLSLATVKQCLALIREIYNKANDWGLYEGKNPLTKVKMPKVKNARERFLTHKEAEALLTELKSVSSNTHDISLISLHCGLRANEIFSLKGQDIQLSQEIIHVVDAKNGESRDAYMTDDVKEILKARTPQEPEEYVFKDKRHGGKIKNVSQAFMKAVERLRFNQGITDRRKKVTFHTLRHTFASWLALQGESLLTIAELLGHKTLDMVKRYAHLVPAEKKKAGRRLEAGFKKATNTQGQES